MFATGSDSSELQWYLKVDLCVESLIPVFPGSVDGAFQLKKASSKDVVLFTFPLTSAASAWPPCPNVSGVDFWYELCSG